MLTEIVALPKYFFCFEATNKNMSRKQYIHVMISDFEMYTILKYCILIGFFKITCCRNFLYRFVHAEVIKSS